MVTRMYVSIQKKHIRNCHVNENKQSMLTCKCYTFFKNTFGTLHRDQNVAIITLLLKKDKDPLSCSSYRPISLISADVKILAKALALRLEPYIDNLIHYDQTGFLKGRLASDNIRRLLHIIDHAQTTNANSAIFSLDALKAFDRLEWDYLWSVLERLGFGPKFLNTIRLLYKGPFASVTTGFCQSQPFPLQRGCRQGCPLSPILFALSLEPLAQALRQSQTITPISINNSHHHISLYADDIMLYLSNLNTSLPEVLHLFNSFSTMSGYKINWNKSFLMALNGITKSASLPSGLVFANSCTYLGIQIADSLPRIAQTNFSEISQKIKRDIQRWDNLKMSMQARISTVKMNILPRVNFVFFMLPFFPSPNFFKEMNSLISKFIWGGKRPRVSLSVLQRAKPHGSLALPNLMLYHLAFQIRAMRVWVDTHSKVPWRSIESDRVLPHRLQDLPFTGVGSRSLHQKFGNIISTTLKAWFNAEKITGHIKKISRQSPLWNNTRLLSGNQPFVYPPWSSKGALTFGDVFNGSGLRTFQDIQADYSLPGTSFFMYLKLRSAMKAYGVPWNSILDDHPLLKWFKNTGKIQGTVSLIYKQLLECSYKTLKILAVWERELSWLGYSPDWNTVWSNLCLTSKNPSHILIHFKTVHKMYCTPYKRYLMKLSSNPNCSLCNNNSKGTFLHMFWDCSVISNFWKHVVQVLKRITKLELDLDPCLMLLNDDSSYNFTLVQRRLLMSGFTAAKKTITQQWFTPDMDPRRFWLLSFHYIVCLERSTARINGARIQTVTYWSSIAQALK